MSVTRLLLIRHAEVEEAYHHVFGGRIDMNLSERGTEQAQLLAKYLRRKRIEAVYASPMKRVQQTLSCFPATGSVIPVILADLREVDFGDWTGLNFEAIRQRFGVSASSWLEELQCGRIPNAEEISKYRGRLTACLDAITCNHAGQRVALFCHGGVIRMLLAILLDLPFPKTGAFKIDYASVTDVAFNGACAEIRFLNLVPWRDLMP